MVNSNFQYIVSTSKQNVFWLVMLQSEHFTYLVSKYTYYLIEKSEALTVTLKTFEVCKTVTLFLASVELLDS